MRKIAFISFCFVFWFSPLLAQLYVSNSSFVYNKEGLLFARGNLELNGATSALYLRNGGQFLQGTTGISTNKGTGKLSVFQEGTSTMYTYNYWCSPVGTASSSNGNEDFGVSMLHVPLTSTSSTPASLTSTSYNGLSGVGSLTIASYWIWRFLSSNNYSQWVQSAGNTNIGAGQGFTMKGVSGSDSTNPGEAVVNNPGNSQRYDFRGKPNDGTITVNVANGASTLTGNPYPSALDLNLFLTDPANGAIDGTALFWEHDKTVTSHNIADYRGGYGVYNGLTSIYTPATFYTYDLGGNQGAVFSAPNTSYQRRFSPVGQGFMVRGIANGSVQIKNSHRVFVKEGAANFSQFERNSNLTIPVESGNFWDIPNVAGIDYTQITMQPTPHFTVNTALGENAIRQVAICFLPSATDGIDRADSKSPDASANLPADMYLVLENEPFVQATTSFEMNKRIDIGFKTNTTTTYTLKVNDVSHFDLAESIYLYDNELGLYYDIKNTPYTITLPEGTLNNRFQITFTDQALSNTTFAPHQLDVMQNNANQLLTVKNPSQKALLEIGLYDSLGKTIFSNKNVGTDSIYQYPTSELATGIYVVRIRTTDGYSLSKKVSITN